MTYTYHYQSPLGGITLSSNGIELTGLWFDGQKYFGNTLPKEYEEKTLPVFEQSVCWLDIYFSGKAPDFTPPLCMQATPFRKAIREIMMAIPFGKTMTYGEIADKIAKQKGISKMSAQAVGSAVGHNSISLIIPCTVKHPFFFRYIVISDFSGVLIYTLKEFTMNRNILIRRK